MFNSSGLVRTTRLARRVIGGICAILFAAVFLQGQAISHAQPARSGSAAQAQSALPGSPAVTSQQSGAIRLVSAAPGSLISTDTSSDCDPGGTTVITGTFTSGIQNGKLENNR